MDTDGLKRFLGRPVTDNEMVNYLHGQDIDVDQELILEPGDYTAHIERPKKGFSLVFADETVFKNKENQTIGEGPLYLEGIFFMLKERLDTLSIKVSCQVVLNSVIVGAMY